MNLRFGFKSLVLGSTLLLFTMGHGDGCCTDTSVLGPLTETVCPDNSQLTYVNFGEPFMTTYCIDCHSTEKSGDDRNGAPNFHDFNTQEGVQRVLNHIDQTAAFGLKAMNMSMPPADDDGPKPTDEERRQLAEWIACGAP